VNERAVMYVVHYFQPQEDTPIRTRPHLQHGQETLGRSGLGLFCLGRGPRDCVRHSRRALVLLALLPLKTRQEKDSDWRSDGERLMRGSVARRRRQRYCMPGLANPVRNTASCGCARCGEG